MLKLLVQNFYLVHPVVLLKPHDSLSRHSWLYFINVYFFLWRWDRTAARAFSLLWVLHDTQRCTTVGRIPLDEWSARRRDLYLTTHSTANRQTSMPPRTYALDRAVTEAGIILYYIILYYIILYYIILYYINSVPLVRTRTIPTERPLPVGEVSANFCG